MLKLDLIDGERKDVRDARENEKNEACKLLNIGVVVSLSVVFMRYVAAVVSKTGSYECEDNKFCKKVLVVFSVSVVPGLKFNVKK